MARGLSSKVDKMKKQLLPRKKYHSIGLCKNKRKNGAPKVVLDFLIDETFVIQNNELVEITAQFADKFKISSRLQSVRQKDRRYNKILVSENEIQAASNSSEAVQNNVEDITQNGDISQISLSPESKTKVKNYPSTRQRKNIFMEKKDDSTLIMSPNNKCKIKSLVTNQVDMPDILTKNSWRKNKRETNKATTCSNNKSSTNNVLEEHHHKGKENRKNGAIKKVKNAQETTQTKQLFSNYIPVTKMTKILKKQSSHNVQYIKGNIRVNPSSYKYAYLRMENDGERDLLIVGSRNRNRAFDGDLVVAQLNSEKYWHKFPNGEIQKTGRVVCILEKIHSRKAIGYLRKQDSHVLFYPKDRRIPLVVPESIPCSFYDQPDLYKNVMFLINIDSWEEFHASGRIISIVGRSGEIDTELQAILFENNLDISPYRKELLEGLPDSDILTDADMKDREDWRHECIFTIDPATAVDIDDAISCKILDNGNYEVGVHISDVTHYLKFLSPLDVEVSKRATTIYMPHTAYHMLPEKLCHICSLSATKDRLAFSIIWEMTSDAEIVKYRFAKTVIRSCCQMSYDMAQAMIENPGKTEFKNFANMEGNHTVTSLSNKVNNLFKLSIHLRNKRFANGALRLDQPKLQICLDTTLSQECGIPIPINYCLEERKDSNSLIEEFMLLANMTVATKLYTAFPKTALLRIHRDPSKYCLNMLCDTLKKFGIHLNSETAKSLQASIRHYQDADNNATTVNTSMKYIMMAIINLCSKTMMRAEYICTSTTSLLQDLKHYALNVPLYTHFTSPIRRYSDCIVHRLLYAAIENKSLSEKWTAKLCSKLAANCNVKKYSAKLAQEQSTELFFSYMVGLADGFEASATVLYVKEDGIEVILCDIGIKLKVDLKEIEHDAAVEYLADHITNHVPTITINWKEPSIVQVINLFSLVHIRVAKIAEELRLKATLLPPLQ